MFSGLDVIPPLRIDHLMRAFCGAWEFPPSEFWRLTMREFWWIHAARVPPEKVGSSSFTRAEVARIAKEQRAIADRQREAEQGQESAEWQSKASG